MQPRAGFFATVVTPGLQNACLCLASRICAVVPINSPFKHTLLLGAVERAGTGSQCSIEWFNKPSGKLRIAAFSEFAIILVQAAFADEYSAEICAR
jgi:hypothetical protein